MDYGPIIVAVVSGLFAVIGIIVPIFLARWINRTNTQQHDDNKIAIETAFVDHRQFALTQFEGLHRHVGEVRQELSHLDLRLDKLEAVPSQVVVNTGHQ